MSEKVNEQSANGWLTALWQRVAKGEINKGMSQVSKCVITNLECVCECVARITADEGRLRGRTWEEGGGDAETMKTTTDRTTLHIKVLQSNEEKVKTIEQTRDDTSPAH